MYTTELYNIQSKVTAALDGKLYRRRITAIFPTQLMDTHLIYE